MPIRRKIFLYCVLLVALTAAARAQESADPSLVTIDRVFNSDYFSAKSVGGFRWLKSGDAYSKIERSASVPGGTELVSYDAATNQIGRAHV